MERRLGLTTITALCAAGFVSALFLARETYATTLDVTPGDITLDSTDLEIGHSGNPEPSDSFEIEVTFTNTEISEGKACETSPSDDPIANGLTITLGGGPDCSLAPVTVVIPPLPGGGDLRGTQPSVRRHHHRLKRRLHGKVFVTTDSDPSPTATIDGEIVALPADGTCGRFLLEAEVWHIDLTPIMSNPVETGLVVGDDTGCAAVDAEFESADDQGHDSDHQGDNNNNQ